MAARRKLSARACGLPTDFDGLRELEKVKEKTQDRKKVIADEDCVSFGAAQTTNALSLPPYTPLPRVLRLRGTPRACRRLFSSTLTTFLCAFIFLPFNELN